MPIVSTAFSTEIIISAGDMTKRNEHDNIVLQLHISDQFRSIQFHLDQKDSLTENYCKPHLVNKFLNLFKAGVSVIIKAYSSILIHIANNPLNHSLDAVRSGQVWGHTPEWSGG